MKLRNKISGEIEDFIEVVNIDNRLFARICTTMGSVYKKELHSLAELNEEWEDVEEPKEYWCITGRGNLHFLQDITDENDKDHREIGNYFQTREEADKAVEKLKAWKRLKDSGFRFQFWTSSYSGDSISFFIDWINADSKKEIENDLDLLFGDEEC